MNDAQPMKPINGSEWRENHMVQVRKLQAAVPTLKALSLATKTVRESMNERKETMGLSPIAGELSLEDWEKYRELVDAAYRDDRNGTFEYEGCYYSYGATESGTVKFDEYARFASYYKGTK